MKNLLTCKVATFKQREAKLSLWLMVTLFILSSALILPHPEKVAILMSKEIGKQTANSPSFYEVATEKC